jgi:phosphatidylinositol glycan class A protein
VIIATHAYGDRHGIRHLEVGIKVYYLPLPAFYNSVSFPLVYGTMSLLRQVFLREQIEIVHGHAAFSTMGSEAMTLAPAMGLTAVFTDHSIFGFADASSIVTNKLLKYTLKTVSQVICVSHTSRENTSLRAHLPPQIINVIPNAVDTNVFVPVAAPPRFEHGVRVPFFRQFTLEDTIGFPRMLA